MSDPIDPFIAAPTPPPPASAPTPARKQNRSGSILLVAAGLVAVAGIAFAAGRLTAPAAAAAGGTGGTGGGRFGGFPGASFVPGQGPFRDGTSGPGAFSFNGGRGGAINLQGQVTAVSSTSITIKLENGTDITVPLDSGTTYHQATSATASAITIGSTVNVQPGAANFTPGASPNADASGAPGFGGLSFGPATDVTVVNGGAPDASAAP